MIVEKKGCGVRLVVTMLGVLLTAWVACTAQAETFQDGRYPQSSAAAANSSLPIYTMMNLAYGRYRQQRLDVYLPAPSQLLPVIVMVHGGAWMTGDKQMVGVVHNKVIRWVPKGAIFVSVNYRLLPDADPVVQANDVALAMAYVQSHVAQWGGDPNKVILMGHSAGAYLVDLISAYPDRYPFLRPWRGTISLDSAAMDVPHLMTMQHYGFYDKAFGIDPIGWVDASPYARLAHTAVPMLLVCSTRRFDRPCSQAEAFAHKAERLGVRVEVLPQRMSHQQINEALGLENAYTQQVEAFIRSLGVAL